MTTKSSTNLHFIKWPSLNVLAFSTTRLPASNSKVISRSSNLSLDTTTSQPSHLGYDSFNLGQHVGDCPHSVAENRKSLLSFLPQNSKIQWLEQVHGSNVINVIKHDTKPLVADAAITRCRHLALAVMTADCLPILLTNKEGSEIAAIHAGWRPLAAGIISHTLSNMCSDNKDIYAWLGPCIGPENFEVGAEVKQAFSNISPKLSRFFIANANKKFQANLVGLATSLLKESGVVSITHHPACTFTEKNLYYSYRREKKTGRMASIICIN